MTQGDRHPNEADGQPHDALFRRVFASPEAAASQMAAILPAATAAMLDLHRLEVVAGSFVDDELRHRHSDLLFSVPYARSREERALVYVLIEHQSSPDPLMPFRLLKYSVSIWESYLRECAGTARLPWVIPLVLYHGNRAWNVPQNLGETLDVPPDARAESPDLVPSFRYLLDDLNKVNADELLARRLTPEALLSLSVMKFALRNPDVTEQLRPFVPAFKDLLKSPAGREVLLSLLAYLRRVSETPDQRLIEFMRSVGPEAEEAAMSTEQQTLERGIEQGIEQGVGQGRALMLIDLLTWRFGPLSAAVAHAVKTASAEQLQAWSMRLVTGADSAEDVIR